MEIFVSVRLEDYSFLLGEKFRDDNYGNGTKSQSKSRIADV